MTFHKIAVAAAFAVLAPFAAQSAVLDLTDNDAYATQSGAYAEGTISGIGWKLTPSSGSLSYQSGPGATGDLQGENDGVGIGDDEITRTATVTEYVTITFDQEVLLSGVYFLDLFKSNDGTSMEQALLYEGIGLTGTLLEAFDAVVPFSDGIGYLSAATDAVYRGTSFTFAAALSNDSVGAADYALAGMTIAAVPLPAGGLLLLGGLAGLAGLKRRKSIS